MTVRNWSGVEWAMRVGTAWSDDKAFVVPTLVEVSGSKLVFEWGYQKTCLWDRTPSLTFDSNPHTEVVFTLVFLPNGLTRPLAHYYIKDTSSNRVTETTFLNCLYEMEMEEQWELPRSHVFCDPYGI